MHEGNPGPGRPTRCPACGLYLEVVIREGTPELYYDYAAWARRCKSPALGGPSMCLARTAAPGVEQQRLPLVRGAVAG